MTERQKYRKTGRKRNRYTKPERHRYRNRNGETEGERNREIDREKARTYQKENLGRVNSGYISSKHFVWQLKLIPKLSSGGERVEFKL